MKTRLILVETLVDGRQKLQVITPGTAIMAQAHASYAVIDAVTRKAPADLYLHRHGDALQIMAGDEQVVQLEGFYADAVAAQYITPGDGLVISDDVLINASEASQSGLSSGDGMPALYDSAMAMGLYALTSIGIYKNGQDDQQSVSIVLPGSRISAIEISDDTGASDSDFITKTAVQTISGTLSAELEAGDILYGSVDGGTTWVDITSKATGVLFEWDAVTLSGSSSIKFKVTNADGWSGFASKQVYVLDTIAPTTTVNGIEISDDTGTSDADFITQTSLQTITATLSTALVAGEILYGSVDGGVTWTDITSKVSGTAISWDGVTLSGSSSIQIKVSDVAGNDSAVASQAYDQDTTASATTINGIDISVDAGVSATDFITHTAAQTITATLSAGLVAGEILYGSVDGGATWTDITTKVSGTAISWDGATLSGSSSIQFKITDAAGNDGTITFQTYVLDTTAPTTTISNIDISADSGTLDTDFTTKTAAQTITATLSAGLVAGEILYGSVDGGATWTDITSKAAGTAISWDGATLSGSSSIQIKVSDVAGNDSTVASQDYVLDTTAPTTIVSAIDISTDTGTSASDFLTKTASQTITATLSDVLGTGEILYGSLDGGTNWINITAKAAGTAVTWDGATLSGSSSIKIKVTDAADNDGAIATQAYVLDTLSPVRTISGIDISADTGISATDFLTGTASQTITATLSAALDTGEILYGSVDGGTTWVDISGKATGAAISWDGVTLSGSSSIKMKVTDEAGNDGVVATQAYVLDTTAPLTTINTIDISADTGTLATDFITKTAAQTITATLSNSLVPGEILYGSLDGGSTWTDITSKASGTAITWNSTTLSGSSSIQFKVTDGAGNDGAVASQAYVLDTTAPGTTISTIDISADTGTSASDFLTKTAAQTITATLSTGLVAGEILYGSVNGGSTWINITAKATGTAISWDGVTLSGSSSIQLKVTDAAGNDGTVATQAYVLDTTAPLITISAIDISADTGTSATDFLTKTAAQTVTGTLSTVLAPTDILYGSVDGGSTWTDITSKASGTAITWNAATLSGSSSIHLKVTDAAGNDGTVATQAYVLDATAPGTTISTIDISADSGTSATDFITLTAAQTITATLSTALVAGEILYGSLDGGSTWTDITSKAISTAITWNAVTLSGSSSIQFKVTDAAGNDGAVASQAYVLDTTIPPNTVNTIDISADTGTSATDFITGTAAQTITATLSTGLAGTDVLWGSVDNGSTWTDITGKAVGTAITWNGVTLSGSSSIKIKVTDAAGNDGAVASQAYVLDVTAPLTTINSIDISDDTGTLDTDFTTNIAAQTITATLTAGLAPGEILYGSVNGGSSWTNISDKVTATAVSWNGVTLSGSSSIKMKVTDAAGNDGTVATQAYVLDTTAPGTTITSIDGISADTGTSSTDFLTNTDAQTITATLSTALVAGEVLYGSVDAGTTWVDISDKASGTAISWDGATLSGSSSIQFKVVDAAGNDGAVASQDYVLDDVPSSIVISNIDISADTGKLATDFNTGTAAQTISATLSIDLEPDDLLWGSVDAGSNWIDITSKASGTSVSWDGATLAGSSSIQMKIVDAAGNEGTVVSQAYVLDGTAPTTLVSGIDISADTGISATDFLTKTAAQTITATLDNALVAGEILWGSVNGGTTWVDISNKASGTAISWNGATLSGSNTIMIKVSDLAGNDSLPAASQAYVLDTTAPTTTVSAIDILSDTGELATDFITNTAAQTITATLTTALVAGEVLYGSVDNGSTWTDISSKASGTAISWDGATLSGSSSIKMKVSDEAGNDAAVATQTYILDTTAPTTTVSSASYDSASNTLVLTGANITTLLTGIENTSTDIKANLDWSKLQWDVDSDNTGNIAFTEADITSARASNGTTLTIILGGAKAVALESTGGFDNLTINDSIEVASGFAVDTAGNTGALSSPTQPDLSATSDSGTSDTDNITSNTTPTFTGTAAVGSTVTLTSSINGNVGSATADGSGNWSITASALSSGAHNITASNTTGNVSVVSSALAITIDTTAPTSTITGATYDVASNKLTLTGTNISTLLTGSETSATDLKANIDWTKLQWDVDSDDTGNITFAETDITSAVATNDTTLTIVLGGAKATALEGTAGFGNLSVNDSVEITAGILADTAGNAATTDVYDGPLVVFDTSIVVFDLVSGVSSDHSSRTFDSGTSYTIYIMVDSTSASLALSVPKWTGAGNLGSDDTVVLVGNGQPILGYMGNPITRFSSEFWFTHTGSSLIAARFVLDGWFARQCSLGSYWMDIWSGTATGVILGMETTLPAGIYTSQGL